MTAFILILMIFLHIWDDFGRQGIMASMKQRNWWLNQPEYTNMYCYDYIVALFMHSVSWAFMIMLPIFVLCKFELTAAHIIAFGVNAICHMIVDDCKANRKTINLIEDQTFHMAQIFITWMIFVI